TRIFGTSAVPTGTLPVNAKRPSGQGAGRGRRASAGVTEANASTSAARRQRARRGSERIGWDVPVRRGGRQRDPIVVALARRMAVARAAAYGTPQWVAVPREVVLMLPPSPEPPATAGAPLLAAVANALGCAPEALAEVRLRRPAFGGPAPGRCGRAGGRARAAGRAPPPPGGRAAARVLPPRPRRAARRRRRQRAGGALLRARLPRGRAQRDAARARRRRANAPSRARGGESRSHDRSRLQLLLRGGRRRYLLGRQALRA